MAVVPEALVDRLVVHENAAIVLAVELTHTPVQTLGRLIEQHLTFLQVITM